MQTMLHCFLEEHKLLPKACARIPRTFFSARVPKQGRVIGMEIVDHNLLTHVSGLQDAVRQIAFAKKALQRVASLLQILQTELKFMHGDMHGENIMIRDKPFDVFIIDFGMSSIRAPKNLPGQRGRTVCGRILTDDRYAKTPFNTHLDLLTLLTALREDLSLSGHHGVARWCSTFVAPYWDVVRKGLLSGKVRQKLNFGAEHTVRSARQELRTSGEIYYAHHLLYNAIGKVSFPLCSPENFQKSLKERHVPSPLKKNIPNRVFEDI
jgi:serine/threonine protein kinase